jgi:UDP-N-acetylmuramoyl-tripeptide--D-alanyl-D-alanine ligase
VREEKVALLTGLVGRQIAVLNRDDPSFDWLAERAPGPVIAFGCDPRSDVIASDVRLGGRDTRFCVDGRVEVTLRLLGRHAVSNALAAMAAACAAGVALTDAASAVERVLSPPGRLQVRELGDVTIIDDTYNANPGSLAAALAVVGELRWPGRLITVMGDMLELGESADDLHDDAGRRLAAVTPGLLVAVGGQAGRVVDGARKAGLAEDATHACEGWEQALEVLEKELRPRDVVLVKGSRGVVLDKLVARLVELAPQVA